MKYEIETLERTALGLLSRLRGDVALSLSLSLSKLLADGLVIDREEDMRRRRKVQKRGVEGWGTNSSLIRKARRGTRSGARLSGP